MGAILLIIVQLFLSKFVLSRRDLGLPGGLRMWSGHKLEPAPIWEHLNEDLAGSVQAPGDDWMASPEIAASPWAGKWTVCPGQGGPYNLQAQMAALYNKYPTNGFNYNMMAYKGGPNLYQRNAQLMPYSFQKRGIPPTTYSKEPRKKIRFSRIDKKEF